MNRIALNNSHITPWFDLNINVDHARTIYYRDIPKVYKFEKSKPVRRKRGGEKIIGRMYNVFPNDVELFHLRVLLLNVPGETSFVDLKTFEGRQYDTFVEVCKARHLTKIDQQWEDILREAALTHMPKQLRIHFASLLQCYRTFAFTKHF